jgi:hypothetical protein
MKKTNQNSIAWKDFHPHLGSAGPPPISQPFHCRAWKNLRGIFTRGLMEPLKSNRKQYFSLEFSRCNSHFSISIKNRPSFLNISNPSIVVAFVQRTGHGTRQATALDSLIRENTSCSIFSPEPDNFTTQARKFPARYLDEVGYTTHLKKSKSGKVQASLPTDPKDESFLLSLMAMTASNWKFFKQCCHAQLVISDSKAETAALALAIRNGINPQLKVVLIGYTLFDNLTTIPQEKIIPDDQAKKLLNLAGLKNYGVPDGLEFMREIFSAITNQPGCAILHMTLEDPKAVERRALRSGIKNLIAIPQIARELPTALALNPSARNTHVLRLSSSTYLQGKETVGLFIKTAKLRPSEKFKIIGKPEQVSPWLPQNLPPNAQHLGWIGNNPKLINRLTSCSTLWIRGGNRNSVIEAIRP